MLTLTNEQAYKYWIRTYPEAAVVIARLLEVGEAPRDIIAAMLIDGATETMMRTTRQSLAYLSEQYATA